MAGFGVLPMHDIEQPALAFHVDVVGQSLQSFESPGSQLPQPAFALSNKQGGVVDKIHSPRRLEPVDDGVDTNG